MARFDASYQLRVGLDIVKADPPAPKEPTNEELADVVKRAIEVEFPYFEASVTSERLDV